MEAVAAVPLSNDMVTALIVLIIVQALILAGMLVTFVMILGRVRALATKVDEQVDQMQSLVANQVQPVVSRARVAVEKLEAVADGALKAVHVTEPLMNSVAQISGAVQKRTTPLWLDLIRLASAVFFTVRAKKAQKAAAEREATVNGLASYEALEGSKNG